MQSQQTGLDRNLQRLIDTEDIRNMLHEFLFCIDDRRWTDADELFADDVRVTMPFATHEGKVGLGAWGEAALGRFDTTHHLVGTMLIRIDGDRATARAKLIAGHVHSHDDPADHFDVGGTYRWELQRSHRGWLIQQFELAVTYTTGTEAGGLTG